MLYKQYFFLLTITPYIIFCSTDQRTTHPQATDEQTTTNSNDSEPNSQTTHKPNPKNFYRRYNLFEFTRRIPTITTTKTLVPDSDNSRDESAPKGYQTLSEIIQTFRELPHNQTIDRFPHLARETFSGLSKVGSPEQQVKEFSRVMTLWMQSMSSHLRQTDWLKANNGETKPSEIFFNVRHVTTQDLKGWFTLISKKIFTPFVEKIDVKPGDKLILHADFHGDIHSLITLLEKMKQEGTIGEDLKLKPGVKMFLLGDYTDRGHYGTEVMYLLGRLGAANPDNFHAVRGNHEDTDMTAHYGFAQELQSKFGDIAGDRLHTWLDGVHSFMPVAYYVGNGSGKYAQLCHGGIEQGYEPKELLDSNHHCQQLGKLNRETAAKSVINNTKNLRVQIAMKSILPYMQDNITLESPNGLGFCWGDFDIDNNTPAFYNDYRGAVEYSLTGVHAVLHDQKGYSGSVTTIIRGHQHGQGIPMQLQINKGHGCCSLRACPTNTQHTPLQIDENKTDVLTLDVARDTAYHPEGNKHGDTALHCTVPQQHQRWNFERMHYPVLGTSTYKQSLDMPD